MPVPEGVHPLLGDVTRPDGLGAFPSVDVVVYIISAGGRDEAAYQAAYVDGLRNTLEAIKRQERPLQRFLLVSSTSVYGASAGEWIDEETPADAAHYTGATIRRGEILLEESGLPFTILRLAGIYGPGRFFLIKQVASGQARCAEGEARYSNRIHREDCVGLLHHLIEDPEGEGIYIGVDHDPADICEVQSWMAAQLGLPQPPHLPPEEAPPVMRGNKRCKNSKVLQRGYTFRYPSYRAGYPAILEEWKALQRS
jgi:nucleoside-diphosphate-sugar epimerase